MASTSTSPRAPVGPARPPVAPPLPELAAAATRLVFGGLSELRSRRGLHPAGVSYAATFATHRGGEPTGLELLDRPAQRAAVVRFSRALGLPQPLPDLVGFALRISDAHGDGRHQDLLFTSSGSAPGARHALLPARGFLAQPLTSILPYRVGGALRMLRVQAVPPAGPVGGDTDLERLASAAGTGALRYELSTAPLAGGWQRVATIEIAERLPGELSERLRFNPWNTGGGLKPAGFVNALRYPAYVASQQARRGSR